MTTALSQYSAEVEFAVPLGLLKAEGYDLQAGPQIIEVGDDEVIATKGDLGVLVLATVLSKTYTYAMRDAVCVAQSAIAGLLGIARTEEIPQPFRVNVTHLDGFLEAVTEYPVNERSI